MTKKSITSRFTVKDANSPILDGTEMYPIIGDKIHKDKIRDILYLYRGLSKHWDCLSKAALAARELGGLVILGSLMVRSADGKSEYGYYFTPPYEFHAWVLCRGEGDESFLFDGGLPGVIDKGLTIRDHIGPSLVGRTPSILAANPPKWLRYRACRTIIHSKQGGKEVIDLEHCNIKIACGQAEQ